MDYRDEEDDDGAPAELACDEGPSSGPTAELMLAVQREGLRLEMVAPGRLHAWYDVGKPIGKGKFSTVYRAVRRVDGVPVALKQIAFFDVLDARARDKCLKEIKLVQSLDHPHIIRYLDGFVESEVLYLVFEYAEAGDLKRQIRKAREREARFDERVIWKYFSQIAEAVAYMHSRRIMHRDLKPANIFLTLSGVVKVGDLGLGRSLSEDTIAAHSKVGTPLYMSPEVLRGAGYEWSSDVWALGCVLYELAMLRSPFKEEGLNLYGLFAKISEGSYPPPSTVYSDTLRDLVAAMLQLNAADRPPAESVAAISCGMRDSLMRARTLAQAAQSSAQGAQDAQLPVQLPQVAAAMRARGWDAATDGALARPAAAWKERNGKEGEEVEEDKGEEAKAVLLPLQQLAQFRRRSAEPVQPETANRGGESRSSVPEWRVHSAAIRTLVALIDANGGGDGAAEGDASGGGWARRDRCSPSMPSTHYSLSAASLELIELMEAVESNWVIWRAHAHSVHAGAAAQAEGAQLLSAYGAVAAKLWELQAETAHQIDAVAAAARALTASTLTSIDPGRLAALHADLLALRKEVREMESRVTAAQYQLMQWQALHGPS